MGGVVEGAAEAQLDRVFQAGGRGEPAQVVVVAERGRGEDPGLGRRARCSLKHVADVQRRLDQPRLLRRDVDPAHMALGGRADETPRQLRQGRGAARAA